MRENSGVVRIRLNRERVTLRRPPSNLSPREARFPQGPGLFVFQLGFFQSRRLFNAAPNRQIQRLPFGGRNHPALALAEALLFNNSTRTLGSTGCLSGSHHAGVPQSVEECVANAKVAGSIPAACSTSGVPLHSVLAQPREWLSGMCAACPRAARAPTQVSVCSRLDTAEVVGT